METAPSQLASEQVQGYFRALLDYSCDCIYFKDRSSRFQRCSRALCERFHLKPEEIIGKTDFDLFDEVHAKAARHDEEQIMETGQPVQGKIEREILKDGKVEWALTSKFPLLDKNDQIVGTFGISKNITDIKEAERKLEKANRQLVDASRMAGMAEVATSVLHNVGNVLNSVNVSTSLLLDAVHHSKVTAVARLAALLREHQDNLPEFFASNPKGKQIPGFLDSLAAELAKEQEKFIEEMQLTRKNIEHIKDIVMMQQGYAKFAGVLECVKPVDLIEDALRMNSAALTRHDVQVVRDFAAEVGEITAEKHKILQILVNLIRNAKYACDDSGRPEKIITLQLRNGGGTVKIAVIDNGVGIPAENLNRIFNHGFTTRAEGHGFGLHSGALAAKEMGGALKVESDGHGKGARFILELPVQPPADHHKN